MCLSMWPVSLFKRPNPKTKITGWTKFKTGKSRKIQIRNPFLFHLLPRFQLLLDDTLNGVIAGLLAREYFKSSRKNCPEGWELMKTPSWSYTEWTANTTTRRIGESFQRHGDRSSQIMEWEFWHDQKRKRVWCWGSRTKGLEDKLNELCQCLFYMNVYNVVRYLF